MRRSWKSFGLTCVAALLLHAVPSTLVRGDDYVGLVYPFCEWEGVTLYYSELTTDCSEYQPVWYWHPTDDSGVVCPWMTCTDDFINLSSNNLTNPTNPGTDSSRVASSLLVTGRFDKAFPDLLEDELAFSNTFSIGELLPAFHRKKALPEPWRPRRGLSGGFTPGGTSTGIGWVPGLRNIQLAQGPIVKVRLFEFTPNLLRARLIERAVPNPRPATYRGIGDTRYVAVEVSNNIPAIGSTIPCQEIRTNLSNHQAKFTFNNHDYIAITKTSLK